MVVGEEEVEVRRKVFLLGACAGHINLCSNDSTPGVSGNAGSRALKSTRALSTGSGFWAHNAPCIAAAAARFSTVKAVSHHCPPHNPSRNPTVPSQPQTTHFTVFAGSPFFSREVKKSLFNQLYVADSAGKMPQKCLAQGLAHSRHTVREHLCVLIWNFPRSLVPLSPARPGGSRMPLCISSPGLCSFRPLSLECPSQHPSRLDPTSSSRFSKMLPEGMDSSLFSHSPAAELSVRSKESGARHLV